MKKGTPSGAPRTPPTTATRCRIRSTAHPRGTGGQAPQAPPSATCGRSPHPRGIPHPRARRFPQGSNPSPDGTSVCTLPRGSYPVPFSRLPVA